jgi:5'-nucleotidase (lipoprotein e(P4) family)
VPPAIHWVATAAEYEGLSRQVYRTAGERVEELARGRAAGGWAVALDADETVISNLGYQRELTAAGAVHSPERWRAWVERREATPLPGAVEFLKRVRELGGRIALVSNRSLEECPATEANFEEKEIPFDVMLCRGPDTSEKEPRWQRVEAGQETGLPPLEILVWVGDNIQDFPDLEQSIRDDGPEAFVEFGRRYFLIPNPLYGSWEANPVE